MAKAKPDATPTPDPEGEGDPPAGDPPEGGGAHVDGDELRQAIRDVLAEMGVGAGGGGGGDGDAPAGDGGAGAGGGTLRAQEIHWEEVVRRELEKVRTSDDLSSLKEEVKKIVERPPRKFRRVERAMGWAGPDD